MNGDRSIEVSRSIAVSELEIGGSITENDGEGVGS